MQKRGDNMGVNVQTIFDLYKKNESEKKEETKEQK